MKYHQFSKKAKELFLVSLVLSFLFLPADSFAINIDDLVSPPAPSGKTRIIFEGGGGGDSTPPNITFDSPSLPYYTHANSVTLAGHANERLSYIRINGVNAVLTNSDHNFQFQNLPLLIDAENLSFEAVDLSNNVRAGTVAVIRDTAAPQITLIDPQQNAVVNESSIEAQFQVFDLHMNPLTVLVDGSFASSDGNGNYTGYVWLGSEDGDYTFTITAWDQANNYANLNVTVVLDTTPGLTDAELLNQLQARSAKYFVEKVFPANGLVLDNSNNSNMSSMAATGFGLAALPVIASRAGSSAEWTYTYDQARTRAELILDSLLAIQTNQAGAPDLYGTSGFFYHFVNLSLQRLNNQIEVSIIDTTILLAGALTAGNYFGGTVETKAEQIFQNVNWAFFFNPAYNQFYTAWRPEFGFNGVTFDRYTDEGLLVSLLALRAAPGNEGFEESLFNYPRYEGVYGPYTLVHTYYGSLFTYVFAHAFYDFEALGFDRPSGVLSGVEAVNWWENAVSAAKANRLFCIDRAGQFSSFGPDSWGLSATVRPDGSYFGDNGAMPADSGGGNAIFDGTVPTAMAVAAMPYFKNEDGSVLSLNNAFRAARHHFDTYGASLWGPYGFYASFNHLNQFSNMYLGIELGPLVLMIENYRSRLIWNTFMGDSATQTPLAQIYSYQSSTPPAGNDYTRECEHWTSQFGGVLDFKPHASNGQCLGGGWGRYDVHYATYALDLIPTNNLVFKLRYASDFGGGWVEIYIDDELRGSFYAPQTCPIVNGCGWDNFQWGNSVQIGGVSPGIHVLKLRTLGTPYGLNIDVFNLRESTATPPMIESLSMPDGSGFVEGDSAVLTVSASDPDNDPVEYQFSVSNQVVQTWSSLNSFNVSAYLTTPGVYSVRIQVRDGFGGVSETTVEYAVFRRPVPPPE